MALLFLMRFTLIGFFLLLIKILVILFNWIDLIFVLKMALLRKYFWLGERLAGDSSLFFFINFFNLDLFLFDNIFILILFIIDFLLKLVRIFLILVLGGLIIIWLILLLILIRNNYATQINILFFFLWRIDSILFLLFLKILIYQLKFKSHLYLLLLFFRLFDYWNLY